MFERISAPPLPSPMCRTAAAVSSQLLSRPRIVPGACMGSRPLRETCGAGNTTGPAITTADAPMTPRIIITRPDPAGSAFADQVRKSLGQSQPILHSPLMRIVQDGTLPDLSEIRALIVTSGNGLAALAAGTSRRDIPCFAVGDSTAASAREAGFRVISAAGDADALVSMILQNGCAGPFLHVRGEHAAGDVAARLSCAGRETREAVLYCQVPMAPSAELRGLLEGRSPVVIPFFSPRSVQLFFEIRPIRAPVVGIAISPRAAAAIPEEHVRLIMVAERPDAEAMLASLPGAIAAAKQLEGGNGAK
ncbi:uroporphyrinogen-III synthase [Roseovarius sp. TE539]|uniref:uroporphyrinogen-III synthase n=1 Tax=Roseovarius sp. TE539 TaxID=2249812 RepID=UPI000DDDDBCF|nr:uroporphyrinogen-III synthase [Roseovarius sp. TE539]RBI77691.1 uroporphyrinogen-III synthase [Roseovarius sp. TE539]